MSIFTSWSWVGVGVALLVAHGSASALEKIVPAELIQPSVCPDYYTFENKKCTAKPEDVPNPTAENCQAVGFELGKKDTAASCVDVKKKVVSPECKPLAGYVAKISGTGATATCSYESALATSSLGDYLGDCFRIAAVPAGTTMKEGNDYAVTAQRDLGGVDKNLTLVPGQNDWLPFGCKALRGPEVKVNASTLIEAGATRHGYAYGFLTMPYKYFPGEKSFQVNVPIGGYVGWRRGQAGSGVTTAFAVTLSSVKANTVDPKTLDAAGKPTVTGTTDVAALAGAFGFVFDILKSPAGKAFKAGVFVGRDIVSKDPTIDYRFNRKTWIAVQLGYDFTDN